VKERENKQVFGVERKREFRGDRPKFAILFSNFGLRILPRLEAPDPKEFSGQGAQLRPIAPTRNPNFPAGLTAAPMRASRSTRAAAAFDR
jgi:hypothetical protein